MYCKKNKENLLCKKTFMSLPLHTCLTEKGYLPLNFIRTVMQ